MVYLTGAACLSLSSRRLDAQECAHCRGVHGTKSPVLLRAARPVDEVRTFGVGATLTRRPFGDESRGDAGIVVAASHVSYDTGALYSGRSYGFGFIGGGSAGFEGGLGAELAFGLRIPFAVTHGPLARVAIEGFLLGNERFYSSMLEVPKGEFGYQLLDRDVLFEAAVTAGPVLAGHFNVEGAPGRTLAGLFEVGGHVAAGYRPVHLELRAKRLGFDESPRTELDEITSSLCGLPSVFSVCADVRYLVAGVDGGAAGGQITYLGLRAGVVASNGTRRSAHPPRRVPR